MVLDNELAGFKVDSYAFDESGRRLYDSVVLSRPEGRDKSGPKFGRAGVTDGSRDDVVRHAQVCDHGCSGEWQRHPGDAARPRLDLVHISVGDIFRWHVQNHTKLGAQVRRTMRAGELVDDELAGSVVRRRLDEHDWNYGFIIDGFPRNAAQAEFFLESYDIDGVIHLDLPDDEVRRRVLARRLCSRCGLDYNLIAQSPRQEGRCDVCEGQLDPKCSEGSNRLRAALAESVIRTV